MQRFNDKVALITGAGSGIGRAAAIRIASEGGKVFCCDINETALDETLAEIGENARKHVFDISDAVQVQACVDECVAQFGKIDVLVNMAGILRFDDFQTLEQAHWQKVVDINLTGTFLLCQAILPELLKTGGNIVNAASTAALKGLPWGAAYAATKGGVLSLTRSIAVEFAKRGVRANCICPGDIKTNMFDGVGFPENADFKLIPRISSLTGAKGPEVVAGVIAMLASDDGIHITGEEIRVEGGTQA